MHMADALVSPAVGIAMWAISAGAAVYSLKQVRREADDKKLPLMGVLGAFVFAAQMINFSVPGTGSSGHLGGGLLLASMLGPYAAFLSMFCVLTIQALFFADGGLLALGCNVFNMGFITCFLAYPLIFKPLMAKGDFSKRILGASLLTAVIGLQFGAFGVVLETLFSGKTELPFGTFVLLMQPIHLAIGIVEGLISAAVIAFVWKERPEILQSTETGHPLTNTSIKKVLILFGFLAVMAGGIFSWFASTRPDGLEWSMFRTSGKEELQSTDKIQASLRAFQEKTAFLPDYRFKTPADASRKREHSECKPWPSIKSGKSLSGIIGALLTLLLIALIGFCVRLFKRSGKKNSSR